MINWILAWKVALGGYLVTEALIHIVLIIQILKQVKGASDVTKD